MLQGLLPKHTRSLSTLLLALCGFAYAADTRAQTAVVGDGGPGPVKAQHLTAELVSLGPAIAPGATQVVGLVLTIEEHWHVYWINPGDSGEPPNIAWTLPTGISAGPMRFPIPERLPLGSLMDFGYEDEVAFPVSLAAAPTAKPGPIHLEANISWLVCSQACIPGKAHLGLDLTVRPGAPQPSQEQQLGALGEAMTLIPKPLAAGAKFSVIADKQQFVLTLHDGKRATDAEFYPYDKDPVDLIVNSAEQMIEAQPNGVRLYIRRSPELATLPATLHGVFKISDTVAYDVTAPVAPGDTAAIAAASTKSVPVGAAIGAIVLAFLGGIILNRRRRRGGLAT